MAPATGLFDGAGLMERERGAALLMALLLAVLVAVLAAGMMRDEQRRMRLLENQRTRDQMAQLGEGALDWARLMLRDDWRLTGAVDHGGEVWALPINDIPVDSVLGGEAASLRLSGRIVDAQSRFNLMSLLKVQNPQGDRGWVAASDIDAAALTVFQRLLADLGLDPAQAAPIARQLLASRFDGPPMQGNHGTAMAGEMVLSQQQLAAEPVPWGRAMDLARWFPDADATTLSHLGEMLVLLPRPTLVNANTASAAVLGAILGVDPGQLSGVMQERQQQFFVDTADLQRRLSAALPTLTGAPVAMLGVNSDYFYVLEEWRAPTAVQRRQVLVARHQGGGQMTQVIGEQNGWSLGALDTPGGGT